MRTIVWGVLFFVIGAALCLVPLFDLLGYELSFAFALVASVAGLDLGVAALQRARREWSRSERERADARPFTTLLGITARATARVWLLLLIPLTLSLLNALRVRNCDLGGGLLWFALLPGLSALFACAIGVAVERRIFAYAIFVGSLLWALLRFIGAPPINAFDPFGGYFPGTLYDENIAVPAALYWARLYHLSIALAALAIAAIPIGRNWFRTALSCAVAIALGLSGGRLGFSRSAADIARALGGERTTKHFVLHYSPSGPFAKEIDLFAEDHELRWLELHDLLKVDPGVPIHAFLFDSVQQKQNLMGAAHTSIAKPWRKEIYLQFEAWPHSVLPHELAHVFASAFGDPIFRVSRDGWSFNVGMIEGMAVAAAWHGNPLTPHEQAHVMRKAGIAPPVDQVLGIRFLRFNNAAAYAEAGSFCRWLLETRGPELLERVYREGGSETSFQNAYGVSRALLIAEWGRFVDALSVEEPQKKVAEERLGQPSVFHKVCAHELALRREEAAHAGDSTRALAILEGVCRDDPDDPENLLEVMEAARSAKNEARAQKAAHDLLTHPKASPPERARAHALLGDLALERRDLVAARAAYAAAGALPLDEANARLVTVKRIAAQKNPPPDALVRFLLDSGRDSALLLANAQELVQSFPDDGLYQYLYGRQLVERGLYARAAEAFEHAHDLPDSRFVREAWRLAGVSRYREGKFTEAASDFQKLADHAPEGSRLSAEDWLQRIDLREQAKELAR
jgi:tetratricopeptide (TPR) repeat protein